MQVDSIQPLGCQSCDFSWVSSAVGNNQAAELFNIINGTIQSTVPNVFEIINSFDDQKYTSVDDIKSDPVFVNLFLQYPNEIIRKLSMEIVNPSDSDDVKMEKIQAWVVHNIEYMEDKAQYGYDELWVSPVMLLQTRKGDCEDGAFLIMSLALNAGIYSNKLQFYGGEVKEGQGSATGGHGWVVYNRSSDNEWIPIDFSYYPDLRAMDDRLPMKDDDRYVKQYFIFNVGNIITSDVNRVRQPATYTNQGYIQPNVLLPGTWMSQYA